MELLLDTANLEQLEIGLKEYPIVGFTTNPTILVNEHKDVKELLDDLYALKLKYDCLMFVQVTSLTYEEMLKDAIAIVNRYDGVVVKVPCSVDGVKVMKKLSEAGVIVCATSIHTELQVQMAMNAGATYIAPYVNHIANNQKDVYTTLCNMQRIVEQSNRDVCLLGASLKNNAQVLDCALANIGAITFTFDGLIRMIEHDSTKASIEKFDKTWKEHVGSSLSELL